MPKNETETNVGMIISPPRNFPLVQYKDTAINDFIWSNKGFEVGNFARLHDADFPPLENYIGLNIKDVETNYDFESKAAIDINNELNYTKDLSREDDHWIIDSQDVRQLNEVFSRIAKRKVFNHDLFVNEHPLPSRAMAAAEETRSITAADNLIKVSLSIVGANFILLSIGLYILNFLSGMIFIRPVLALCFFVGGATFVAMDSVQKRDRS